MKRISGIIMVMTAIVVIAASVTATMVSATEASDVENISIDTVTFKKYVDESGNIDDDLLSVAIDFTVPTATEQITVLVTSEDISELNEETMSKIIHIDQTVTPEDTTYEFVVSKSRINSALSENDTDLSIKMGATDITLMASSTVEYVDPYSSVTYGDVTGDGEVDIGDAIKILRYDAKLETLAQEALIAAEVTGDGVVDIGDAIKIMRYDAKLESSLK